MTHRRKWGSILSTTLVTSYVQSDLNQNEASNVIACLIAYVPCCFIQHIWNTFQFPFMYLSNRKTWKKKKKRNTFHFFIFFLFWVHNVTSYYKLAENFVLFYLSRDPKIWGLRLLLLLYAQSGPQVSIIALWLLLNHG